MDAFEICVWYSLCTPQSCFSGSPTKQIFRNIFSLEAVLPNIFETQVKLKILASAISFSATFLDKLFTKRF